MKLKNLTVIERHYDAELDAYVVLAKHNMREKGLKRFVVGWHSRHDDTKLASRKAFIDYESAEKYYEDFINGANEPEYKRIYKDWQQYKVYSWEADTLEGDARILTEDEARAIIKKVSRDYGMKPPKLVWKKRKTEYSTYDENDHQIDFGHRDEISLLHEIAHAVHAHNAEADIHHGPAFVWIAIELYNRYAGVNLQYLITSAKNYGLLGDMDTDQSLDPDGFAKSMSPAAKKGQKKPRGPA